MNVWEWEFTDSAGNTIHEETLVSNSFVSFGFDIPLTDTLFVSVLHTNDSVFHNGSEYPWACLVEDYLTWEIYTYPNGTEYGSWTLGESAGVDVSGGEVIASVQNPDWDEFEIFPNPVTDGQIQLRGLNLRKGVVHAELVSLTGARVNVDMNSVDPTTGECILHIGDLTPGIYLLRIEQQGMWATRKLVIR